MSQTTIYAAFDDGVLHRFREFPNAFRSAIPVWDYLASKYVPAAPSPGYFQLWDYEREHPMVWWEREALLTTYDLSIMVGLRLKDTAHALSLMSFRLNCVGMPNTLQEQARAVLDAVELGASSVAWWQTNTVASPYERQLGDVMQRLNALDGEWVDCP